MTELYQTLSFWLLLWFYHIFNIPYLHGALKSVDWKNDKKKMFVFLPMADNAHTDPLFKKLNLPKVRDIYQLNVLKLYHKFRKDNLPFYTMNMFTYANAASVHDYNLQTNSIGNTCLHVPAGCAGISRWRQNMPAVVRRAAFRFVCRAFSPTRCRFQHSSVVPGAPLWRKLRHVYVKIVRLKCTQTLTVIIFCWSRDTVLLCSKNQYLQTHIYVFTTRIVAGLLGFVTRLTATTAILSRMCR